MSNKDLRRQPHKAGQMWWYEEPAGIEIYSPLEGQPREHCLIRWDALRRALTRKEKNDESNS